MEGEWIGIGFSRKKQASSDTWMWKVGGWMVGKASILNGWLVRASAKAKGAGVADGAVGGVLVRLAQSRGSVSRST